MFGWKSQRGDGQYKIQMETDNKTIADMMERFAQLMTDASSRPVPKGKWVYGKDGVPRCSVCGAESLLSRDKWEDGGRIRDEESSYCPECGAEMY